MSVKLFWDELKLNSVDKTFNCVNEWDYYDNDFNKSNCICGKDIFNIYKVKNTINDNILNIGIICINKFMNANHSLINKIKLIEK